MKKVIRPKYKDFEIEIDGFIDAFDSSGEEIKDERNKLKLFKLNSGILNIKSFKIPNLINQVVYKFFRKSKAQRSFEYANTLMELGIGTPQPIAYYENSTLFLFKRSFYVSEQLDCDLTYRELIKDFDYPNHEKILRAFTRFTFNLHEKGIHFLDHSPGNTLIQLNNGVYKFYLVDLNRMRFETMDFETRIKNFSRLTKHKYMVEVMSDEYAKALGENYDKVFNLMWKLTKNFQKKHHRKRQLKKKFMFWK
ncbi:Kdo domain containing protein [Flavobacteriaceae bacterium AH-315-B10]|nr:Kdo domain containing protein [Flavobacteriaceae bacterium AH-315-B10]